MKNGNENSRRISPDNHAAHYILTVFHVDPAASYHDRRSIQAPQLALSAASRS